MKIIRISASSARKVPHSSLEFASLSSLVSLEAEIQEGDVPEVCIARLQAEADKAVDVHLQRLEAQASGRLHWSASEASRKATEDTAGRLAAKHGGVK